jgi:hypothetical protein
MVQQWLSTEKKGGENRIMQRLDNQLTAHRYIATQFVDYSSYQQSTHNYECPSVPHANRIRVLFISYTDADKKEKKRKIDQAWIWNMLTSCTGQHGAELGESE